LGRVQCRPGSGRARAYGARGVVWEVRPEPERDPGSARRGAVMRPLRNGNGKERCDRSIGRQAPGHVVVKRPPRLQSYAYDGKGHKSVTPAARRDRPCRAVHPPAGRLFRAG